MTQNNEANDALNAAIDDFLADLANADRSPHTIRAYASDLHQFATACQVQLDRITADTLRTFMAQQRHLSPATRSREQAALASFLNWADKHDLIADNPMPRIERIKLDPPPSRAITREAVEAILSQIPPKQKRDQLLFKLLFETGLRIGEALALHVEDIDLTLDDEHITVVGKRGRQRTVLLDDPKLVKLLRRYLKQTGYKHGPLFRAQKNGTGGPLRYQSVQERWASYCAEVGVACTMHQLRHTHATELINEGVSLNTIRKRLGHKNLQTTLRYADQSDAVTDRELRTWRRQKNHQP